MNKPAKTIIQHEGEKAMATPNTALSISGTQVELQQYASRLKLAMRGGDKLTGPEALALAQIALVTHLDPFVGEIWYIPGKGPMIGIAGARRLWNEKSAAGGGFSFVDIQPCSPSDAGATETDVVAAFRAVAHDSGSTREYMKLFQETLTMLREAKADDPLTIAKEICGPKPQWIGYGYSTKSETSRMNKMQLARKRAEADALKKCIIVPFGADIADADQAPQYVEGTVVTAQPTEEPTAITYDEAKQIVIKVQGGEKFMGELTAEQLQYIIDNSQNTQNVDAARVVLKHDFSMESAA